MGANNSTARRTDYPARTRSQQRRQIKPSERHPGAHEVSLTQGKVALIDESDRRAVADYAWYAARRRDGRWYARTAMPGADGKRAWCEMHIFLMRPPRGMQVDHKDGDGLNNRRGNLRVCTHAQNTQNARPQVGRTSKYKGVHRHVDGRWRAQINANTRRYLLGYYDSELDAAIAYDHAARRHFGEFAVTNASHFPEIAALDISEEEIRHRISHSRKHRKGTDHGMAKLTPDAVRRIRQRYASGEATHAEIAASERISRSLVSLVVRREIWKHVD